MDDTWIFKILFIERDFYNKYKYEIYDEKNFILLHKNLWSKGCNCIFSWINNKGKWFSQ